MKHRLIALVFQFISLMPASWKTVRVFISSTFRDMHAERNRGERMKAEG